MDPATAKTAVARSMQAAEAKTKEEAQNILKTVYAAAAKAAEAKTKEEAQNILKTVYAAAAKAAEAKAEVAAPVAEAPEEPKDEEDATGAELAAPTAEEESIQKQEMAVCVRRRTGASGEITRAVRAEDGSVLRGILKTPPAKDLD
ncbi:unnamed protein product [Cladocopium goreaui]|uniref:Uncharacterized protein n=1 Tax=Cladocopium goreaui TaxID=2562237 RepID=A0A9P1G6Q1_9DINO|nr:unnamed protein product [Cladocopium goreaui]